MNTKLVIALFLGAVSPSQLPNINMLTVSTDRNGVKELQKEVQKMTLAADDLLYTGEFANALRSGEQWWNQPETTALGHVLQDFSHTGEAQRLQGHGDILGSNVKQTQYSAHIDNKVLVERLTAIEAEIDHIEHETYWHEVGEAAFQNAMFTPVADDFFETLEDLEKTRQFKRLEYNVTIAAKTAEKYVKVDDLPAEWQHHIQRRAELNLIDITVAPAGQQAIMKEYQDVEGIKNTLPQDPAFKAFTRSGESWSRSSDVQASVKQLEAFSQTREAREIQIRAQDLKDTIEFSVSPIVDGVRIDNSYVSIIKGKAQIVEGQIKALKPTPQMQAAFKNSYWKNVEAKGMAFAQSARGQQLQKEIYELHQAMQRNIKVTDFPR